MKCSERLQAVARWVPAGTTVADIGADHAHLLIHLVLRKRIEKGIAGELNKGPFENARSQVRRWGLSDRIEVRRPISMMRSYVNSWIWFKGVPWSSSITRNGLS